MPKLLIKDLSRKKWFALLLLINYFWQFLPILQLTFGLINYFFLREMRGLFIQTDKEYESIVLKIYTALIKKI
jgi:hypothetical protein